MTSTDLAEQRYEQLLRQLHIDPATLRGITWDDFIELPEELLQYVELHDGEVALMATGTPPHQLAITQLIVAIATWSKSAGGWGDVLPGSTVRIDARNAYVPDVAWYRGGTLDFGGRDWTPLPVLVVEVLSPSTRRFDERVKVANYLNAGVEEVWLVDIEERTVRVASAATPTLSLAGPGTLMSAARPGFTLELATLWR